MRYLIILLLLVSCAHDMHSDDTHIYDNEMPTHVHEQLDVPAEDAPSVDLRVHQDPKSGLNLQIITENFHFAPKNAGIDHVPGEGHAHLYINDEKITRLYGEWYYLAPLPEGTHELKVTLNTNSHEDYAVAGETVADTELVFI